MRTRARRSGVVALTSVMVATGALSPAVVRAQAVDAPAQMAQGNARAFNIPAQSLSSALVLFGQQAGRHLTVDSALVRGLSTPGVQGTMTTEEALGRLPDRQREAIVLCHYQELGNIEAAAVMGVSVEALESLLGRGRRALRAALIDR